MVRTRVGYLVRLCQWGTICWASLRASAVGAGCCGWRCVRFYNIMDQMSQEPPKAAISAEEIQKQTQYKKGGLAAHQGSISAGVAIQQYKNNGRVVDRANNPPAQYNRPLVEPTTQHKMPLISRSPHITKPSQLLLALHHILSAKHSLEKQVPPTTDLLLTIGGTQRLALGRLCAPDLQALGPLPEQHLISVAQSPQQQKIKSVQEIQKRGKKIIRPTNFEWLACWAGCRLFEKGGQTYLLIVPSSSTTQQQQKVRSLLAAAALPCLRISPCQLLVFRPQTHLPPQLPPPPPEHLHLFEDCFRETFGSQMDLRVQPLTAAQLASIRLASKQHPIQLDLFQPHPPQNQYHQHTLVLCIAKENHSRVEDFLANPLGIPGLGFKSFECSVRLKSQQVWAQDMLIYKMPMELTQSQNIESMLERANEVLRRGMVGLKAVWGIWLRARLQHIVRHWGAYKGELRQQLVLFIRLHELNLLRLQQAFSTAGLQSPLDRANLVYQIVYPDIVQLIHDLSLKLELQNLRQLREAYKRQQASEDASQSQAEVVFRKMVQVQLQAGEQAQLDRLLTRRAIQLLTGDNRHRHQAEMPLYQQMRALTTHQCQSNLAQILHHLEQLLSHSSQQPLQQKQRAHQSYLSNIENQKTMNSGCLGCCRLFYQNLSIEHSEVGGVPVRVFASIEDLREGNAQFVDTVCGMLNSGGGVILFDCQQISSKTHILGSKVSQVQKEQKQHRLQSTLNLFYPRVERTSVQLSFVPVYGKPQGGELCHSKWASYQGAEQVLKKHQPFLQRTHVSGCFVGRIIVRPTDLTKTYIYSFKKQKNNQSWYADTFQQGTPITLPLRTLRKIMKQKIRSHCFSQQLTQFQTNLIEKDTIFDHICAPPEVATKIPLNPRAVRTFQPTTAPLEELTLVFCKASRSGQTKKLLEGYLKGGKYQIMGSLFGKHKFKSQTNVLYLFHRQKFQSVFQKLRVLQQKNTISLVSTVEGLKLLQGFRTKDLQALQSKVRIALETEFMDEELQFLVCEPASSEKHAENPSTVYIRTKKKQAAVFLYLYLRDRLGTAAQFKLPEKYNSEYAPIEIKPYLEYNQQSEAVAVKPQQFANHYNQLYSNQLHSNQPRRNRLWRKQPWGKQLSGIFQQAQL